MTTSEYARVDRVAAAGPPYPYPTPLPSDVRNAHEQAARRASDRAALWGVFLGTPATFALIGGLTWRSGVGLLLLIGGAAGLVGLGLVAVPHGRRLSRHRAVLAAYGIATAGTGVVQPSSAERAARARRAAVGTDLRVEARRALRLYQATAAVCAVLVIGNALVAVLVIGPVDSGRQALSAVAVGVAAVIGLVAGALLTRALRTVRVASEEKLTFGRGVGVVVFVLGIATGGFAGDAVHSVSLDREPARLVAGFVTSCESGRRTHCNGVWEVDGQVHSGRVPFGRADVGRRVEFEVSVSHPHVIVTQANLVEKRVAVWVCGAVLIVLAAGWRRMARTALRRLRTASGFRPR